MKHGNYKKNDQIAYRIGKAGSTRCQSRSRYLFITLFTSRLHTTSDIRYTCVTTIPENRLPRHNSDARRLFRSSQGSRLKKSTTLFHTLLCRKKVAKKRAFENLLNSIFQKAQDIGLFDEYLLAAVDATGLENRHTSRYYVRRKGYKRFLRYEWPKVTVVCDTKTHLFAACVVTRGPSNDSPQFAPAVLQASKFVRFDSLLADAAYDGEHNHQLCREELGIAKTMIPLNKRRSRKWPKSKYRRQMKTQFDKELYNQRWQVESAFSRNKRLLGSALRARTEQSRERECLLRILTHNLMIIRRAA